jgi:BarA-like signal transduction histidine kinase
MKRRYCRVCSDLAGYTRNICAACHAAEVERHMAEAALTQKAKKGQPLQVAYGKAIVSQPLVG